MAKNREKEKNISMDAGIDSYLAAGAGKVCKIREPLVTTDQDIFTLNTHNVEATQIYKR